MNLKFCSAPWQETDSEAMATIELHLYDTLEKIKPQRWADLWVSEATSGGEGQYDCTRLHGDFYGPQVPYMTRHERVTLHRCQGLLNYI